MSKTCVPIIFSNVPWNNFENDRQGRIQGHHLTTPFGALQILSESFPGHGLIYEIFGCIFDNGTRSMDRYILYIPLVVFPIAVSSEPHSSRRSFFVLYDTICKHTTLLLLLLCDPYTWYSSVSQILEEKKTARAALREDWHGGRKPHLCVFLNDNNNIVAVEIKCYKRGRAARARESFSVRVQIHSVGFSHWTRNEKNVLFPNHPFTCIFIYLPIPGDKWISMLRMTFFYLFFFIFLPFRGSWKFREWLLYV